jgi:hypothetical protein
MKTAEELAIEIQHDSGYDVLCDPIKFATLVAIEFAKQHVTKTVDTIYKNVEFKNKHITQKCSSGIEYYHEIVVDKNHLKKIYPIENIK